ncbi:MAG: hypothetical protein RML49_05955 [Verrucomicrobiae bacterium]|nr:hypothetical protein [Verrucomicrobiae bacterium]
MREGAILLLFGVIWLGLWGAVSEVEARFIVVAVRDTYVGQRKLKIGDIVNYGNVVRTNEKGKVILQLDEGVGDGKGFRFFLVRPRTEVVFEPGARVNVLGEEGRSFQAKREGVYVVDRGFKLKKVSRRDEQRMMMNELMELKERSRW